MTDTDPQWEKISKRIIALTWHGLQIHFSPPGKCCLSVDKEQEYCATYSPADEKDLLVQLLRHPEVREIQLLRPKGSREVLSVTGTVGDLLDCVDRLLIEVGYWCLEDEFCLQFPRSSNIFSTPKAQS